MGKTYREHLKTHEVSKEAIYVQSSLKDRDHSLYAIKNHANIEQSSQNI